MVAPIWLLTAWGWIKRNWMWLIFPVGIILYLVGRFSADTDVTVVSPGLVGHEEAKNKLEVEAAQKKAAADAKVTEQLAGIEDNRSTKSASETQKQIDNVKAAQEDPNKVNDLLKNIGKDMRK